MVESHNKTDQEFIKKFTDIVEGNMDSDVNIRFLTERMNMSQSTLYRRVKVLTNMSINKFVRKIRLQNAERLLRKEKYSISEIAFMIGMCDSKYLSRCFKDEYGQTPTHYVRCIKKVTHISV